MHTSLDNHRGSHPWRLRTTFAAAVLATLALPGSALAATKFKLVPHIANHTPTVNKNWPITIDVTKGNLKLGGSVKYQFLFAGSVVSRQPGKKFTRGVYRDTLVFPSDSLGQPLTLRIIVTTKYGTEHIDWKVTSRQ